MLFRSNDTATTEIYTPLYTLSLHDALPIYIQVGARILREYMGRAGEMEAALQMYNGALDEPTARYAGKVLAEKARLQQFLLAALGEF